MPRSPIESLRTHEYDILRLLIREKREAAQISQETLSQRLGKRVNYVGKVELGSRRLDVVELVQICDALSLDAGAFIVEFRARVAKSSRDSN